MAFKVFYMVTLPVALRPWARWGLLFHFCDETDRLGPTPCVVAANRVDIEAAEDQGVSFVDVARRRRPVRAVVADKAHVLRNQAARIAIARAGSGKKDASVILQNSELLDCIIPVIPISAVLIESLRLITCPGRPG